MAFSHIDFLFNHNILSASIWTGSSPSGRRLSSTITVLPTGSCYYVLYLPAYALLFTFCTLIGMMLQLLGSPWASISNKSSSWSVLRAKDERTRKISGSERRDLFIRGEAKSLDNLKSQCMSSPVTVHVSIDICILGWNLAQQTTSTIAHLHHDPKPPNPFYWTSPSSPSISSVSSSLSF